jgi:hypothetical protein
MDSSYLRKESFSLTIAPFIGAEEFAQWENATPGERPRPRDRHRSAAVFLASAFGAGVHAWGGLNVVVDDVSAEPWGSQRALE